MEGLIVDESRELMLNLTEEEAGKGNGLSSESSQCFLQHLFKIPEIGFQGIHCSASWDNYTCWPPTGNGTWRQRSCSDIVRVENSLEKLDLPGYAFRFCSESGEWDDWTNYSACHQAVKEFMMDQAEQSNRLRIAVASTLFFGSVLSLICLLAALFIFHYFKNIRCDRITLHNHFMMALVLKCITFIMITEPTLFGKSTEYFLQNWVCKTVTGTQLYASLASVNWMFVQGHYLNAKLTTNVFGKTFPIKGYIMFGWGFSLATIVTWCVVMDHFHPSHCWKGYPEMNFVWIIVGPMLAVLLMNLLYFGNILRVLLVKSQETRRRPDVQILRAFKATMVLFPLLGLNILLFFYNPGGVYQAYSMMINAILHSSQGMLVAIWYCFICTDVREAIRTVWKRMSTTREALTTTTSTRNQSPLPMSMSQL